MQFRLKFRSLKRYSQERESSRDATRGNHSAITILQFGTREIRIPTILSPSRLPGKRSKAEGKATSDGSNMEHKLPRRGSRMRSDKVHDAGRYRTSGRRRQKYAGRVARVETRSTANHRNLRATKGGRRKRMPACRTNLIHSLRTAHTMTPALVYAERTRNPEIA